MGYFLGLGHRQVFVEEDGTYWDSPQKNRQFTEQELFPEKFQEESETGTESEASATITETTPEEVKHVCPNCNLSMSLARWSVHKRICKRKK